MSTRSKVKRQVRRNMREHPKARRRREAQARAQKGTWVFWPSIVVTRGESFGVFAEALRDAREKMERALLGMSL